MTISKSRQGSRLRLGVLGWAIAGVLAACSTGSVASDDDDQGTGGSSSGTGGAAGSGVSGATSGGTAGTGVGGAAGATGGTGANGGQATGGTASPTGGSAGAPQGSDFYVGPSGSDTNPGTQAAPFLTLNRANAFARAGSTIWVLPGTLTYNVTMELTQSGTAQSPIELFALEGARPVLDYMPQARASSARGIEITGNYWHVRGLEIKNAGDNGIAISGSNNTVENVVLHNNGDTGLQITVSESAATIDSYGANNTILNCDSYENFDMATNGENADGFAAKLRIGAGNVFRGCRAWNNADDGYDLFAADDVVTIEDSWAFLNGRVAGGGNTAGDGNGFKLGGEPAGTGQGDAPHRVTHTAAFENRSCGYTRNNNATSPVLMDCSFANNGQDDFCDDLAACSPESDVTVTGAQAKALARNADGSLPDIN